MPRINNQKISSNHRDKPAKGILWTEISITGKDDNGNGQFTAALDLETLSGQTLVATTSHIGIVNVGLAIRAARQEIIILLGDSLQGGHHRRKAFHLPAPLPDNVPEHQFSLTFADWLIGDVYLDNILLYENTDSIHAEA